jgi:hypothetical protein
VSRGSAWPSGGDPEALDEFGNSLFVAPWCIRPFVDPIPPVLARGSRSTEEAIGRIERAHPALGRHLQASIRTGVFCSYTPERDVHWTVDSDR